MVECIFSIKASSGSYDRIQLHGSIWRSYFLQNKMVGVTLEYNWMFHFCGVLIEPVGVTIEYNCKVQYGGVLIFYKKPPVIVTIEYNCMVQYDGVSIYFKRKWWELQ